MTPTPQLERLIEKWRREAELMNYDDRSVQLCCADELQKVVDAHSEPVVENKEAYGV